MFLGQYRHSLDDKGRLTIPAKFRDELAGGAHLTQGFDHNLRLVTKSAFDEMVTKVSQLSEGDPLTRILARLIFSGASEANPDSVGRILIPQFLREVAGLADDAVIVGVGKSVEIWSPAAWDEQMLLLSDFEANSQRFAALDL